MMIYSKFPQRYLAAIVFFLILTLAALGCIFIIYLFNGNSSPLPFRTATKFAVAKPPKYFSNSDSLFNNYRQNFLHKDPQFQHGNVDLYAVDELVTLDDFTESTPNRIIAEQQISKIIKQPQRQNVVNSHIDYYHSAVPTSYPNARLIPNSDELSLKNQKEMFSQNLQHQSLFVQPMRDIAESVVATKKMSSENQENAQLLSALTSMEKFNYQIASSSRETSDTIYIDDFERQTNIEGANVDDRPDHDIARNLNISPDNMTGGIVRENSVPTSTSSSLAISSTQNVKNASKLYTKAKGRQRSNNHLQQLRELVKKKIKNQRLFNKLQHKNHNSDINNMIKMNSNKQIENKLLLNSEHTLGKHQNFQHGEDYLSAYDKSNSINDDDNIRVNSGSGDFNGDDVGDSDDDDYDIDLGTTNYIKRINIKLWRSMRNTSDNDNDNAQRRSNQYKQQQQKLRQLQFFNNKQKKLRSLKQKQTVSSKSKSAYHKYQNFQDDAAYDGDHFYSISSEIISNAASTSAPQPYQSKNALRSTQITDKHDEVSLMMKVFTDSSNISKTNNNDNNQLVASTVKNEITRTNNNSQWLLPSDYSVKNIGSNQALSTLSKRQQLSSRMTDLLVTVPESIIKTASSDGKAAWLETRTRRIMGNVKKSEERSRQLLLCEEAGGGELCRMLFKGHLNE